MREFSANEIVQGLKSKDTNVLDFIYENFFYQIKVFIVKNNGTEEDARDIYQDALLIIFQKLNKEQFALSCSFNTYLYSVCRLLWLKQLERKRQHHTITEDAGIYIELDNIVLQMFETNDRYSIYQEHFNKLSFSCQKVLELFLAGIPLKEIANILGFKSEIYARKRKHMCKEKLVKSIKADPRYKNISSNFIKPLEQNEN